MEDQELISIGRITGTHGYQGLLKVKLLLISRSALMSWSRLFLTPAKLRPRYRWNTARIINGSC